jgi:hypothetical protein
MHAVTADALQRGLPCVVEVCMKSPVSGASSGMLASADASAPYELCTVGPGGCGGRDSSPRTLQPAVKTEARVRKTTE